MGVYRRKNKDGTPSGPWIIQYPIGVNPQTGKVKYTSEKVGVSKRLADLAFGNKLLEWQKKKHFGLEKKKEYLFRELVDWYLKLPRVMEKRSYMDDKIRSVILKDAFGNYNAREIKPGMIERFQHDLLSRQCQKGKKTYAPATINRFLALMKRIYSLAMREEYLERNPCFKVSALPENNTRDRVLTREEFTKLLSELPVHAARIVLTAYYTGMRAGEIFKLTWNKVNLKERCITLEAADTKTKEQRKIFLNDALADLFSEIHKVRYVGHNRVFTYDGLPVKSIRSSFLRACRAAGIQGFHFHDLRHTFNTNMRKAGVDRSVIMKITGHKTMSMFERYNTVDGDDAQDALRRLDGFLARPVGENISTSGLLQERTKG